MSQAEIIPITNRRRFLQGTVSFATPAVLGFSAPATAAPSDDKLLAGMAREFIELYEASERAYAPIEPLHEEYARRKPERPDALRWRMTDPVSYWMQRLDNGKCRVWIDDAQVEQQRGKPLTKKDFIGTDEDWNDEAKFNDPKYWGDVPDEKGQRRFDEIVVALDAYEAECDSIRAELGLDKLSDAAEELGDRVSDLRDKIFATPAETVRGIRAKAAVYSLYWGVEDNKHDHCVDRAVGSILRDLIGMSGA